MSPTRREVVLGLGALGAGAAVPRVWAASDRQPGPVSRFRFEPAPFSLGVASGDPTPGSVMLWTRLADDPLGLQIRAGLYQDQIEVDWAVATDPAVRHIVAQGRAPALARHAHAVHVDARGLTPATTYYYRFAAAGRASRIGRTRTAPEGGDGALRFAAVSCQDFVAQYGAFAQLAREPLDFVLHLGDTIYEAAWDGVAAVALDDYRRKHALFRADPLARDAWAAHPFLVTWDDHEVAEGYRGTDSQHDVRRDAAYQAFHEHMPVRLPAGVPPRWRDLQLYRHIRFGDLLELDLLDLRQYRDPQSATMDTAVSPGRTLLGAAQKRWLLGRLRNPVAWRCLGSPLQMADYRANLEGWEGYAHERAELLRQVREETRHGRTIVVSGDAHRAFASRLLSTPGARFTASAPLAAVEFGTPALSSKAPEPERADPDRGFAPDPAAPWVLYEDRGYRGYLRCDLTRDCWRSTYRVLQHGASQCMTTLASFRVSRSGEVESAGFVPFSC
jgi:alkaline phosphatase D